MDAASPEFELICTTLRANAEMLAESFAQCVDLPCTLELENTQPWQDAAGDTALDRAGMCVYLACDTRLLLVVVPAGPLLPDWVNEPNLSQRSRLDTLAMEWSLNALPESLPCEQFGTLTVANLRTTIAGCCPGTDAQLIRWSVNHDGGSQPLFMIWPVSQQPVPQSVDAGKFEGVNQPQSSATSSREIDSQATPGTAAIDRPRENRISRLLGIPVTVIVKLAEKKIEVGQLLTLSQGTIVTFEKSCEDLLDLYVNNSLYARGEAVKIGEKFGLKINEVGSIQQRLSAILQPSS